MNGYIRLLRKFLNWEWYKNTITKSVFLHCLLKANWEDGKFEGMVIKKGSFVTGRKKMAEEIGISEQQLRTALKHLKSTNEITIDTTSKYSIISINNYDLYQADNQIANQQLTSNQPTTNQQLTTNEKEKEEKEINIYTTTNNNQTIFDFVEENFGRPLSPIEYEEICKWSDTDLTRYAVRQAVLNGKYSIKYISKILYEWKKKKIRTVQEAQKNEEEWNQRKKSSPKVDSKSAVVPEWFDKTFEEEEMSEDERREIESIENGTYRA